jgi:hypothetical protein
MRVQKKGKKIDGAVIRDSLSWKSILKEITMEDSVLWENYFKRASVIFFKLNKEIASIISVGGEKTRLDLDKVLELIKEEFKLGDDRMISANEYTLSLNRHSLDQVLFLIEKNLFLSFDFTFNYGFVIFYCSTTNKKKIEKIKKLFESCKREIQPNYTHFLVDNGGRLSLRSFKIEAPSPDSILSNYNDDFREVDLIIREKMQQPFGQGVVLLHGPPGVGKTTYLRYLISVLKKRIIYIPPNMAHIMGAPDFIKFMADYPSSIVIIEDAEDILAQRNGEGGTTISNLLNLSDGILGDCLNIQIICTFNADLATIDRAILRKGRLIARYEFGLLGEEKCKEILKKLDILTPVTRKMTLAELYNMKERDFQEGTERKIIGFNKT